MMASEVAALCDQIRDRLVGSLTLYCGDRAVAEELAQDALVRLWEHWPEVRDMASPEGWAFRVGTNLAGTWYRRKAAERRAYAKVHARLLVVDSDPGDVRGVRDAVRALPERQRAVIVARFYLGYDVAGTAAALGIAPGTVKATTHHAISSLRAAGLVDLDHVDAEEA